VILGATERSGPPDGPVIVFIHGSRVTKSMWGPITSRLADTFRCIAVDLPGHGARADEPFSLEAAAGVVDAAIAEADDGRAIVVGLSLGGYVAMVTAARSPERARGLVLAGSSAEPSGLTAHIFRLYAWALAVAPRQPVDALNDWIFRRRYPPEVAEPLIAGGYWSVGGSAGVRTLVQGRFRDRLVAFGGPILVINGELDLVFRIGERSFLRGLPNVERRTFRLSTHLSPLDRPADFADAVRTFAERLPG